MGDIKDKREINVGISFLSRVSSTPGSPAFIYSQPLINTNIYFAPWILLGAQVSTLIANRLFKLEKIPVLDVSSGELGHISAKKFLSFLGSISSREEPSLSSSEEISSIDSQGGTSSGFPTQLPPDFPMYIALYLSADYSRELYTPSIIVYIPLISLPGLRGALPFLVLALLGTILVRCVVDPSTTGAKP